MKNKLLVSVFVVALISAFMTSCREKTDFDAIANDISKQTLQGYFSGADALGPGMIMTVIQFQFKEDGSVERTTMSLGDNHYIAPQTTNYSSWALGDYCDGRIGRYLLLNPADGGEPLRLKFYAGSIEDHNQPAAGDKNDKVGTLIESQTALVGKKWYANDTVYHKIDTVINVVKFDTTYTYKPKKDPETGKTMRDSDGHVIYEQTIKDITEKIVPTKMKWPVAPKTINIRALELYRDPSTMANTGKWYMKSVETDMNAAREITVKKDTTSTYEFRWCFKSYASAQAYVIKATQSDGKAEFFDIKYDGKIPAITLDKQILKISE